MPLRELSRDDSNYEVGGGRLWIMLANDRDAARRDRLAFLEIDEATINFTHGGSSVSDRYQAVDRTLYFGPRFALADDRVDWDRGNGAADAWPMALFKISDSALKFTHRIRLPEARDHYTAE